MRKIILSIAIFAVSFTATAQVGVGTITPDASAALDIESTTKGFLPPRMTNVQMNAIPSPAEGLLVYCTDCIEKGYYYYEGSFYTNMRTGLVSHNGIGYQTVISDVTSRIWLDRNLGASQVATSLTDGASYGDYYQWGRATDGHQLSGSGTVATQSTSNTPNHANFITGSADWLTTQNDNLWQGVDGVNNPCPKGFRLPNETEWTAEIVDWSNNSDAYSSFLKLPAAGFRHNVDGVVTPNTDAAYWSSGVTSAQAYNLSSNSVQMDPNNRAFGFPVRCIKD
ncbi:hypothetical protein N9Q68_01935 [Polaribacter sp.]|nr:hypothetical protein [Polaribacter sp.]